MGRKSPSSPYRVVSVLRKFPENSETACFGEKGDLKLAYDSDYVFSYDDTVHFLANFSSLKKMSLSVREEEIIFSRNVRNTCSPPLPNLKYLKLKIPDNELKRKSDLEDSVSWCAPSLETLEIYGK
ncbi:hypothetical protein FNV43_RR02650 [Rhamnella rubrinervis]|uniref:Uncharacterized protein n=1 Tax=Rhamnella rubrinervis TaxID=2594499 RepID=A0A8K0MTX1_9ROSA|nr:hypothetical protein FNV43_RR02650 [Rhamnella rubrinervis]